MNRERLGYELQISKLYDEKNEIVFEINNMELTNAIDVRAVVKDFGLNKLKDFVNT